MAKQSDIPHRSTERKPQLNLEVTEAEKVYFEKLAQARGMKLAKLVRQLLNNEAQRLGIPALLIEYKSSRSDALYQYQIKSNEVSEIKLGVFRQFLETFKSDCDFSIDAFEVNRYTNSITCTAYSSSGENTNKIWLELASEPKDNYQERRDIDNIWHDVLGLSLLLKDKWNGVNYVVEARRTLKGKKILLREFIEENRGATFTPNVSYNGRTTFKLLAINGESQKELLIEYLPERVGEAAELQQALSEYQQAVH